LSPKRFAPQAHWEAGTACRRHCPLIAAWHEQLSQHKGKFKANAIVANQLGRAIYPAGAGLKNGTAFDVEQLVGKNA